MYLLSMPRKARITVPGAVHHVMVRGIEGSPVFRGDTDRKKLFGLIEKGIHTSGYLLYAWCFMPNHYHLVLRIGDYPLGAFMRSINGPYAQYFRKLQEKRGYLFQDRYKSLVTDDQNYVQEMIRYVHLNPIRGKICTTLRALAHYQWSGHSVLMGTRTWEAQNTKDVLNRFGNSLSTSRKGYEQFIADGLDETTDTIERVRRANSEIEDMHQTGCWVIGNRDFILKAINDGKSRKLRLARAAQQNIDLESLARTICGKLEVDTNELKRKGRNNNRSRARKIIAYLAYREYEIPVKHIARFLGTASCSVSNMLAEGEVLARALSN